MSRGTYCPQHQQQQNILPQPNIPPLFSSNGNFEKYRNQDRMYILDSQVDEWTAGHAKHIPCPTKLAPFISDTDFKGPLGKGRKEGRTYQAQ